MEFLDMFGGNIPSLIVIAAFLLISALINNGYLTKFFNRKGKGKTLAGIAERMDKMESEFIPNLDSILSRIEGKLDVLSGTVNNMENRLDHVDKSAQMANVYNREIDIVDRLCAFHAYLCLGGNGLVAEYAVRELVKPNRDVWLRVLRDARVNPLCKQQYDKRIEEINKSLTA